VAWIWSEAVAAAAHDQGGFSRSLTSEWARSSAAWRVPEGVTAIDVALALREGRQPKDLDPEESSSHEELGEFLAS